MKKLFLLPLALFALHLGARAQDTSIVFGTAFYISGGVAQGGSGIVYQWQCNGNNIEDATNKDYTTLTTLKPGFYTYVRKSVCEQCGGRWQYSNPHTIEVKCPATKQASVIGGTGAVATQCAGSSYVYTVDAIAGYSFNWVVPAGWTQTAGDSSRNITVTTGNAAGTIRVTPVQTGSGCVGTERTYTVTTVNAPPSLTLVSGSTPQYVAKSTNAGPSMTPIVYARTGTYARIDGLPTGVTSSTANKSATIGGTTTLTTTATTAYNYTVTDTAAGCTTKATKTGKITVCPGEIYGGECYQAKGNVLYNAAHADGNCVTWFGAEYTSVASDNAVLAKLTCPLNGVGVIFTGSAPNLGDHVSCWSVPCGLDKDPGACGASNRPSGVRIGTIVVAPISVVGTSSSADGIGFLCKRTNQ